jgi:hypothetical protein
MVQDKLCLNFHYGVLCAGPCQVFNFAFWSDTSLPCVACRLLKVVKPLVYQSASLLIYAYAIGSLITIPILLRRISC